MSLIDFTFTVYIPLLLLVFWIWMLVDFIRYQDAPSDQRIFWILGFIFLSLPTAILYYFMVHRQRHL